MNCWRVQNLVVPFLEGEIPEAESEAIAEHLEQCGECLGVLEAVESLPELQAMTLDPELSEPLFEQFDRDLQQRIAEATAPELPAPRGLSALARREIRVPASMAAAWIGVMFLLAGGVALNHQRVQELQASVERREAIIQALQERMAFAEADVADPIRGATDAAVFLPATAPTTLLGSFPLRGQPVRGQSLGASIQHASFDVPRVVH